MIETESTSDSTLICRVSGELDFDSGVTLRHLVGDLLRPGLDLVVDLGQVAFIDAVGVSALVGTVRRVRATGGSARVCNVSPRARWVLELAGVEHQLAVSSAVARHGAA